MELFSSPSWVLEAQNDEYRIGEIDGEALGEIGGESLAEADDGRPQLPRKDTRYIQPPS